MTEKRSRTIGCGAGFAGDRTDAAVTLVERAAIHAIGLECLAERTLVPGLRARLSDPDQGADPRLRRRLAPLLRPAYERQCRVISNLGAANPVAAGRQAITLAKELGLKNYRVASIIGDDVMALRDAVEWVRPLEGELIGAHAYLGADAIVPAVERGAQLIVTGRVADSALFSAEVIPILHDSHDALAGATAVGHLLECSGQVTGGNFEMPNGDSLTAEEFANLGFPLAKVFADGSAEFSLPVGQPGRIDALTCTLQLLYEVHDPSRYITPDVILDMTDISFTELDKNRVLMVGAHSRGRPDKLKVSGFVDEPGLIADIEIGYAGTHALRRGQVAADTLRLRLEEMDPADLRIDLVGVNSTLGPASLPSSNRVPEVRVHISAKCLDAEMAQWIEDEVYALTLSGPAGGGSVRSEKRPRLAVVDGFIHRELVKPSVVWETTA